MNKKIISLKDYKTIDYIKENPENWDIEENRRKKMEKNNEIKSKSKKLKL